MIDATEHVRLAHHLAHRYWESWGRRHDLDELRGEAMVALVRASQCYRSGHPGYGGREGLVRTGGVPFGNYASKAIYNRLKYYREKSARVNGGRGRGKTIDGEIVKEPESREPEPGELTDVLDSLRRVGEKVKHPRWWYVVVEIHLRGRTMQSLADEMGVSKSMISMLARQGLQEAREILEGVG